MKNYFMSIESKHPVKNISQQTVLSGNYFIEIFLGNPIIEKLLSGSKRNNNKVQRLNNKGDFMILKLKSDNALVILKRKKSKLVKEGIECQVFINNSVFLYYQLIIDVQKIAALRWPNQTAFISINPTWRKHIRLHIGLKEAGWRNSGYKTPRKIILEKVLNGE